ncbi:MAG TPA: hypothetical protein VN428_21995 [Bryobacteraceae bacterium]|nr:hypothetical protein [Bryobacteraceae bacterium]
MGEQPQSPELAELERVLASPEFRSSRRGQRVLRYLVEHALTGDSERLKERSVGFDLFDRDADYDTARYSIVRVAANDVRKRLAEYYVREYPNGAVPALRIQLPAGSYAPVFQRAEAGSAEGPALKPLPAAAAEEPVRTGKYHFSWKLAAIITTVALGSAALALWLRPSPAPYTRSGDARPTVDLLWQQVFHNGRPTCMVLSDANLTMFEEMLGRQISVQEYVQKRFTDIVEAELKNPQQKIFAELLMRPPSTSMADASATRAFGVMNGNRIPTDLVFARDFGTQYFESHNVVLLGSLRSNPWVGVFEQRLHFQSGASENPVQTYFENRSPRPGERKRYAGVWNREGYCRVAFLPNIRRNGNVLILSGTGLSTTAAGSEFITNEAWMRKFRALLGPAARERFPHFEVLLRVDLVATAALNFNIEAWRTY